MQVADSSDVPGPRDGGEDFFFCVAATSRSNKNKISYFHTNAVGEDAELARTLAALCLAHAPEYHRWHHHTVAGERTFAFLLAEDGRTYFAAADPTPGAAETVRFLECIRDACDAAPRKRLRDDDAVAPVVRQFAQALRAVAGASSGAANATLPVASPGAWEPSTPLDPVRAIGAGGEKDDEPWWRRHALVVIGVDVVVCLVLFVVWMSVCKGFRCLA